MNFRTKLLTLTVAFAAAILSAACGSSEANRTEAVRSTTGSATSTASPAADAKARDVAFLRVVHAAPGAGAIDVATDKGTPITNTSYKQVTPYKEVHSEAQTIRLLPSGQANVDPLASNREILIAGNHYTAVAASNADGKTLELRVFNDNITPPAAGKAKVRVLHASPDAGDVDVFAKGNNSALLSGIDFQSATGYEEIDPVTNGIEIRQTGQSKAVLNVPDAKFEAGKIYTVIVTGKAKGTPRLEATVISDELIGAPGAAGSPSPTISPSPQR